MSQVSAEIFSDILKKDQILNSSQDLKTYGQDWSQILTPNPSLILLPKSTEEVAKILRRCFEKNIPVVPSGGRTGLSGGAVAANQEVVLSLEKINHIGTPDLMTGTLRVQAGTVTQAVHEACKPFGLTWPVDFASKGSSQVGGNLSTNAGGINVIHYGNTRNWVLSVEVVLMDGEILEFNGDLEKNNTGFDLRHLVIGAEGTLGVITAATLKLAPIVREKSLYLLALKGMNEVAALFESCRSHHLSLGAFEYLSQKSFQESLSFYKIHAPLSAESIQRAKAFVVVEILNPQLQSESIETWFEKIFSEGLVVDGAQSQSSSQSQEIWKLREGVAESVMAKDQVYQHDVSVPVRQLTEFSQQIEEFYALNYPDFEVFIFGHIGDGNLHIFIRKPASLKLEEFLAQVKKSDQKLFGLIQKFRGSVSAEHGIGILKKSALPYSRSPRELQLFREIKKAFDPKGLLNPGKII